MIKEYLQTKKFKDMVKGTLVISAIASAHPMLILMTGPIYLLAVVFLLLSDETPIKKIKWTVIPFMLILGLYVVFYFTLINPDGHELP